MSGNEMQLTYRPNTGRIVGGIAAGIANRYGIQVLLVRLLFLAGIVVSGIGILLYVLMWISTPREVAVLARLRLASEEKAAGARFDLFAERAVKSLGIRKQTLDAPIRITIAFLMLVVAIVLQTSQSGASSIGYFTPIFTLYSFFGIRAGMAILYFCIALIFLTSAMAREPSLVLTTERMTTFQLDRSETRALLGVVSGFGSLTGIEISFLRVALILINFLTLGATGLLYLVLGISLQKKGDPETADETTSQAWLDLKGSVRFPRGTSLLVGGLFVVLSLVRIATEFRLFFFNESFAVAVIFIFVGILIAYQGLEHGSSSSRAKLWLIGGSATFLYGIYQLSIALFTVQQSQVLSFQIVFAISGVSLIYFALALLVEKARKSAVILGAILLLPAAIVQWKPGSVHFLFSITQFYAFFYPLLFAACGLWLLVERGRRRVLVPVS